MKKSILYLLALFVLAACSKNDDLTPDANAELRSIITSANGWKVTEARFGNEEAPVGMYDDYTIKFAEDGSYVITNPNGGVNPNFSNPNNFGTWVSQVLDQKGYVFDNAVFVEVVEMSRTRLHLRWFVQKPGKVGVYYEWVLNSL